MTWSGTRRRVLALAGVGAVASFGRVSAALAAKPLLSRFRVGSGGAPFAGDGRYLTTLGASLGREAARLHFSLARRSVVTLNVLETGQGAASERPVAVGASSLEEERVMLEAGDHTILWTPPATLPARTYVLSVTADPRNGRRVPVSARAVARVLGVDAAFNVRSAKGGDTVSLYIRTDAAQLTLQMMRSGIENVPTYSNNDLHGVPVSAPVSIDWKNNRDQPGVISVPVDMQWGTGVYFARLEADDGRLGFAPLIVRPQSPSQRVAVVLPTSTWAAYNFYDADGDGWGDTWYAHWRTDRVDLTRPQPNRGIPYRYRSYDLGFQHWLAQNYLSVDTFADEDLEGIPHPTDLRNAYDLVVFPGHTEYVTGEIYDLIQGFRDLGGNLMFLSANNFFRRIDRNRDGVHLKLIDEWRDLNRPEEALLGVHYVASDRGQRHAPFTVTGADVAPWAFANTGLANGSTFGLYGIEIDARGPASPANVQVLATIADLFGPGRSAEMTYYEHESGAKVFSAGALNFGGQVTIWPQTAQILKNVWQRLA